MPFARISLARGKSRDYLRAASDQLHAAMVESFDVPPDDIMIIISTSQRDEWSFGKGLAQMLDGATAEDLS